MLHFVDMGSSSWLERPWVWRLAVETPKEDPPKCWCQDVCKAKQSDDWDETRGRRFWLCPNYAKDKEEPANLYDRPKVCVTPYP